MLNDKDAFTRWNREQARHRAWQKFIERLKMLGLFIVFLYVVWDVGHYEPDSETAQMLGESHGR